MDSQDRVILHKISEIKPSHRDTAQHRAEGAFKLYLQQKNPSISVLELLKGQFLLCLEKET